MLLLLAGCFYCMLAYCTCRDYYYYLLFCYFVIIVITVVVIIIVSTIVIVSLLSLPICLHTGDSADRVRGRTCRSGRGRVGPELQLPQAVRRVALPPGAWIWCS